MSTATIIDIVLTSASMIIALLTLHLCLRGGKRQDPMCVVALLATMFGLNLAARAAEAPGPLWQVAVFGMMLFLTGLATWREGLRRSRATG
jgi:hypothetical protein